MLIDELMPEFDAIRTEHLLVDMPLGRAWEATLDADFIETATSSKLVRGLFAVRTTGEKAVRMVTRKPAPPEPDARKGFMRYWRPLSPFIGMVLRAQLRLIARSAA